MAKTEYDQGAMGKPPDKVAGQHRWIVLATYVISNGQAAAAESGARVNLDHENRIGLHTGCLDCEGEYNEVKGKPCPAEGYDW